jgi:hypothetical protein
MNNRLQLWDDAVVAFTSATSINPQDSDSQWGLAVAECKKGEIDAAAKAYRKLMILSRSKAQTFFESYASCLELQGLKLDLDTLFLEVQ